MTIAQSIDSRKDTRPALAALGGEQAGLSVVGVMPFDMPPAAGRIFEAALEREQWLSRLDLRGIVTGVANHDMREFTRACDRLLSAFKWARLEGRSQGVADTRARWRWIAAAAGVAGVLVGVAVASLLGG